MSKPLVSIIIPCFNSEMYVMEAINSALNQKYENIEILLVDNNSSDNTLKVLNRVQSLHPYRVKVFEEPKKGAPAARNRGLKEAKGSWIQFLDSDDVILPWKISNQIAKLKNCNANLIIGDYFLKNHLVRRKIEANHSPWIGLINGDLGRTSSILWESELVNRVKGWDENQNSSQEYYLLFKILKLNPKIVFTSPLDTIIYQRVESISKTQEPEKLYLIFEDSYKLRLEIKQYLSSKCIFSNEFERAYEVYILKLLLWSKYKCNSFFQFYLYDYHFKLPVYIKWSIIFREMLRRYLLWVWRMVMVLAKN